MDINKTEELKRKLRVLSLRFDYQILEINKILEEMRGLVNPCVTEHSHKTTEES